MRKGIPEDEPATRGNLRWTLRIGEQEGLTTQMHARTLALQAGSPDILVQFLPILIIGVVFYLLVFMPMRKKQKKVEAMISALRSGDKVITSGGIYGVIRGVKDKTLILQVADQVKIEIAKSAVAGLQSPEEPQGL
jgi:preprotein translocase subunit YajC